MSRIVITLLFLLVCFATSFSQERVLTAGFQFKPIFTSNFLNTGPISLSQNGVDFKVSQKFGYCAGMVVRYGISNTISFETGINFVRRNFDLEINSDSISSKSDFGIVGYEIPFSALAFIKLANRVYMNGAIGISLDFFPSDIYTSGDYFQHLSLRRGLIAPSVIANLGFEYRTEKVGYFYIGASFHRPFADIYTSKINYDPDQMNIEKVETNLTGNYLTFDIRYFFSEVPIEKKAKKAKKKKDEKE